jgi:iron-sulfur cluster repair protein YtfE (RIC family)
MHPLPGRDIECKEWLMTKLPHDLPLAGRAGLPAEFQVILADFPRGTWQTHPDFNGLAAFWLDRHLGFRQLCATIAADTEAMIDRTQAPDAFAGRLSRLGSRLLGDLIGHHQIEDSVYFPKLARLEPRITRGFDMLDRDHHDLHGLIDRFAGGANRVLQAESDTARRAAAGDFLRDMSAFNAMLIRHLTDEEDLVLPVVLKHRVG